MPLKRISSSQEGPRIEEAGTLLPAFCHVSTSRFTELVIQRKRFVSPKNALLANRRVGSLGTPTNLMQHFSLNEYLAANVRPSLSSLHPSPSFLTQYLFLLPPISATIHDWLNRSPQVMVREST